MYQLTVNDQRIGYTEKPMYCYKLPSGIPQVIDDSSTIIPTGIIYLGVIYNLPNCHDWEDADTAYISEIDTGVVLTSWEQLLKALNVASVDMDSISMDQELRLTILELDKEES